MIVFERNTPNEGTQTGRPCPFPSCRRLLAALLLVLLAPVLTFPQSIGSMLDRAGFSPANREAIQAVIDLAEEEDVPRELLVPRLAEGIAKRVPPERIARAMRGELAGLVAARRMLVEIGAGSLLDDQAVWARTANLLDARVRDESIAAIARAAVEEPEAFRPATALLVSLTDWGLEDADAASLAVAAIASGLEGGSFPVVLELLIETRAARREIPEMVELLREALPNASSARSLRRAVGM
ncbi:MAG: hypothetical protein ACOC1U_07720 [Spirochaetota bacterium]